MANIQEILKDLAPTGKLRASINVGNPILAKRDGVGTLPYGVSIDLSNQLGKELNTEVELVVFEAAGKSVEAVSNKNADFGFFAVDPVRGKEIYFTSPYIVIEGAYLVKNDSALRANEEVDKAPNRIVVGKGSAYDLYLTREIKNAQLVRAETSPTVINLFLEGNYEVAAGVKQQLESDITKNPNLRLLPGKFMEIRQAMGVHKTTSAATQAFMSDFVERMKRSGFVSESMVRHQIKGAMLAPLS